LVLC